MFHQKRMKDMRIRLAAAMLIAVLLSLGTANLAAASVTKPIQSLQLVGK